jgi:hypothetical protein
MQQNCKQMVVVVARKIFGEKYSLMLLFLKSQYGEKISYRLFEEKNLPQLLSENCSYTLL